MPENAKDVARQHFPQPRHDQPNKGRQNCRVCGLPIERVGKRFASDGVRGQWKHLAADGT